MPKDQIFDDQCSSPGVTNALAPSLGQRLSRVTCRSAGFTLVELVVVTGIIGVLATLAIPTYNNFIDRAKIARAKSEVRMLETEINAYRYDINAFPVDLAAIHRDGLIDPWGRGYVYSRPPARRLFGEILNDDYDVYCLGADGLTADSVFVEGGGFGNDDIVRARNGVFIGSGVDF